MKSCVSFGALAPDVQVASTNVPSKFEQTAEWHRLRTQPDVFFRLYFEGLTDNSVKVLHQIIFSNTSSLSILPESEIQKIIRLGAQLPQWIQERAMMFGSSTAQNAHMLNGSVLQALPAFENSLLALSAIVGQNNVLTPPRRSKFQIVKV